MVIFCLLNIHCYATIGVHSIQYWGGTYSTDSFPVTVNLVVTKHRVAMDTFLHPDDDFPAPPTSMHQLPSSSIVC